MDNIYVLFILALIPIIWLIVSLGVMKIPGHKACPVALVITLVLSIIVWKMPALDSFTGALEGIVMGLWPIVYIIIAAVFTYNLTTYSGSMETIKNMMTGVSSDKRILVLILAWGFGGFLEAIAGFGTAVASRKPPKPQASMSTRMRLSEDTPVIMFLMVSILPE